MSVLIILMLLGLTLPAAAITFGVPDREKHPYVGVALFIDEVGEIWPCSGTLISPTVFLTAGHCTYEMTMAIVLFDPDLTDFEGLPDCSDYDCYISNNIQTHPDFDDFNFPNTSDVGVVIFNEIICPSDDSENCKYGNLPAEEDPPLLDDLATQRGRKDTIIRTVGYGLNMVKPFPHHHRKRYTSTSQIVNLRSHLTDGYNIHTSNNPGKGQGTGGSCFGDSGGPIIYPQDSDTVVGVVSFGLNKNCKGADFAYRTDIPEALDWINSFLP
jgi:V8-like Glu-specific endopeptidase